jgi:hypothetical protein
MTTLNQPMEDDMNTADNTDTSFPYVLATSILATIVSLAAVWTATALGPVAGF